MWNISLELKQLQGNKKLKYKKKGFHLVTFSSLSIFVSHTLLTPFLNIRHRVWSNTTGKKSYSNLHWRFHKAKQNTLQVTYTSFSQGILSNINLQDIFYNLIEGPTSIHILREFYFQKTKAVYLWSFHEIRPEPAGWRSRLSHCCRRSHPTFQIPVWNPGCSTADQASC